MAILSVASCAPLPKEVPPELYWPFPPETPRIKFEDIILGSIDVAGVRTGRFSQLLFGEETEVRFKKPTFLTVKDNVMYVSDVGAVHVYDFGKKKFHMLGTGVLANPTGIAIAPGGKIFIGDTVRKKVFVFDEANKKFTDLQDPDYVFEAPAGVAIDYAHGRVVVSDARRHQLSVWTLDGTFLFSVGRRGEKPGEFNFPYDVAVDDSGNIYVVDSGNFRIQVLDSEGNPVSVFGSVGISYGQFARPKGIAIDSEGHIYVVDAAFGNFQIFDKEGNTYLFVGSSGNGPAQFILPSDIFVDNATDKIYVVDQLNKRIQVFRYLRESSAGIGNASGIANTPSAIQNAP